MQAVKQLHPSCHRLDPDLVENARTYEWQCMNCKSCAVCGDAGQDDKMLFCDSCDRGYHTFCVGLNELPKGRWVCKLCGVCASCGTTAPGPSPDSKWRHEYAKNPKSGKRTFVQTLCMSCSTLFRKGHFCPACMVGTGRAYFAHLAAHLAALMPPLLHEAVHHSIFWSAVACPCIEHLFECSGDRLSTGPMIVTFPWCAATLATVGFTQSVTISTKRGQEPTCT